MAGAVWTAVQIPLFGGAVQFLTARRARYVAHTRSQRREDWIEVLDYVSFATNHHAVAALQAPHTTACPHVHVVDALRNEFLCAPDIIHIIRVPSVDEDVFPFKIGQKVGDGLVY
jgi:hypothetical protein